MNGSQAQLITLVAHGNYFLHDPSRTVTDLSNNSTFQYVNSVFFAQYKSRDDKQGVTIADHVSEWFEFLVKNKVKRLWYVVFAWDRVDLPEHIAVSFSNAVPIAIQADLPDGFELWYPLWKTGGQPQKPWTVEYRGLMFEKSHIYPKPELSFLKMQLNQVLTRAEEFTVHCAEDIHKWGEYFVKSQELLDSSDPVIPYYTDLLPPSGYAIEARQIIAAASQAYVFGGMGSWNDLSFKNSEVQNEYEKLSKDLYEIIKLTLAMASNSFAA